MLSAMRPSASLLRGKGSRSGWYWPRQVDQARCSDTSAGRTWSIKRAQTPQVRGIRFGIGCQ
jgi:hypothetical protein